MATHLIVTTGPNKVLQQADNQKSRALNVSPDLTAQLDFKPTNQENKLDPLTENEVKLAI